jgi:hypothetical protein
MLKRRRRGNARPKSGKALSDSLRRLAPNLRQNGIDVEFLPRQMTSRPIHIEKIVFEKG